MYFTVFWHGNLLQKFYTCLWQITNGSKYSKMEQVEFVEDAL